MRHVLLIACASLLLATPVRASTLNAEASDAMKREAVADRYPDRWQGRQHYLIDDTNKTHPETIGHGSSDALECSDVRARVKRADGSTAVRRFNRCD